MAVFSIYKSSHVEGSVCSCRCGRGIPHGQENRFCCSGAGFVCGGGGNATVDGNLGSSTDADSGGDGDSRKRINCARVNDNYADCPDGSDEPGTSAASHLVSIGSHTAICWQNTCCQYRCLRPLSAEHRTVPWE